MVLPLPHPSWRNNGWLKKNPWFEGEYLPFLRERIAAYLQDDVDGRTFSSEPNEYSSHRTTRLAVRE